MEENTVKIELTREEVALVLRSLGDILVTCREPTDLSGIGFLVRALADASTQSGENSATA